MPADFRPGKPARLSRSDVGTVVAWTISREAKRSLRSCRRNDVCNEVLDNGPLPHQVAITMIPLIRRIACQLARRLPSHISVDDLISSGTLGLMSAYRRHDSTLGEDFRGYAVSRIRGAMLDDLRSAEPTLRPSALATAIDVIPWQPVIVPRDPKVGEHRRRGR